MKKLFGVFVLFAVMFCGCSEKSENGDSETDITSASSLDITTKSNENTVSKTTAVTEPAEEKIILTPLPSETPFEISACDIIE